MLGRSKSQFIECSQSCLLSKKLDPDINSKIIPVVYLKITIFYHCSIIVKYICKLSIRKSLQS